MTNSTNLVAESLGEIKGFGPLGDPTSLTEGARGLLEKLLSNIIGFMTVGAILWFIVQIVIGGYSLMTAGGDPKGAADARQGITNAVIGLVVVFIALVFISVIGFLMGIDILKIDDFINNLSIK